MENCLVTQLKSVVQNDNLVPIGVILLHANELSEVQRNDQIQIYLKASDSNPITVNAKDGGYFGTSASTIDSEHLTSITIGNSGRDLFFKNGSYRVEVGNKYGIVQFDQECLYSNYKCLFENYDANDFTYCNNAVRINGRPKGDSSFLKGKNFQYLIFNGAKELIVNLSDLESHTNCLQLNIDKVKNVTGQISSLGKMTSVGNILGDFDVNYNVEDFVSAQISNGRTTCTGSGIHWNRVLYLFFNNNHYDETYGFLTWESASKIAVYTGSNTFVNTDKVYCKGYTQQEAEAAFAGKTIVRVDA